MSSRPAIRRAALGCGGLLLVSILFLAGLGSWVFVGTAPQRTSEGPANAGSIDVDKQQTLLILGVDGDGNTIEGQRTDSILLARIIDGRADLLSFPRDLLVSMPPCTDESGEQKINGIFALASSENGIDAGARCLAGKIEEMTEIPVDDYVVMNMESVVTLVDQLDGIDLCLSPTEIEERVVPSITETGCHHVNGTQAMEYARARKYVDDSSDLSRIDRQHVVLEAVTNKARTIDPFWELPLFMRLAGTVNSMTETSLSLTEAREVTRMARTIASSDLGSTQTIPIMPAEDGASLRLAPSADAYFAALQNGSPLPTQG
ncbi:Putative transcriptional regulator YwtF [Corynebacterium atrinae]|uniref:LCP family protein n=1 Tax=Corynebacterium atrinae TaxID=1336740 RepID=UPI0025B6085C|nr:LCP family protein [Corynebacterium atrinae]WJY64430.1 Putative transcriptional regulator YwtF [Corynebacterium atrinae]